MVLPGHTILFDKRFEVLSVVGRGRETVVYHARVDGPSGDSMALKVLAGRKHRDLIENRLRHEACLLLLADHPHVITLHGLHAVGDYIYIAMEYAPHGDLLRYSKNQPTPLPTEQMELFFQQCLEGLIHLENLGIVHRDIKPDNILVIAPDRVKLGDFGVATLTKIPRATKDLELAVGTMNYLSPEVLEGAVCDHQSDLYAFGLSFYHLLSGSNPFDDIPLVQQLELRRSGKIPDLKNICPRLSSRIANGIMKMLAYRKEDRFASASELKNYILNLSSPTAVVTSSKGSDRQDSAKGTQNDPHLKTSEHGNVAFYDSGQRPLMQEARVLIKPSPGRDTSILKGHQAQEVADRIRAAEGGTVKVKPTMGTRDNQDTDGIPAEVLSRFRMGSTGTDPDTSSEEDTISRDAVSQDTLSRDAVRPSGMRVPASDPNSIDSNDPGKPRKKKRRLFRKLFLAALLGIVVASGVVLLFATVRSPGLMQMLGSALWSTPASSTPATGNDTPTTGNTAEGNTAEGNLASSDGDKNKNTSAGVADREAALANKTGSTSFGTSFGEGGEEVPVDPAQKTGEATDTTSPVAGKSSFGAAAEETTGGDTSESAAPTGEEVTAAAAAVGTTDSSKSLAAPATTPTTLFSKGLYAGTLTAVFPQPETHLSFIALPNDKGVIVVLGIDGWTPQKMPPVSAAKNTKFRVASNGIVLEFTGTNERGGAEGIISGTVQNLTSGRSGTWKVKTISTNK